MPVTWCDIRLCTRVFSIRAKQLGIHVRRKKDNIIKTSQHGICTIEETHLYQNINLWYVSSLKHVLQLCFQ